MSKIRALVCWWHRGHIFRTQMWVNDVDKTVPATCPETGGGSSEEPGSGEIFKSGSVGGS